jgi:hypothetical protein
VTTPGPHDSPGVFTSDGTVWRWTGSNWDPSPAGAATPGYSGSAVYDAGTAEVVAYAGRLGTNGAQYDTWTWKGTWTKRSS